MIEEIQEFRTGLQVQALAKRRDFDHRKVDILNSWPSNQVTNSNCKQLAARYGFLCQNIETRRRFPAFAGMSVKKTEQLPCGQKQATLRINYFRQFCLPLNLNYISED